MSAGRLIAASARHVIVCCEGFLEYRWKDGFEKIALPTRLDSQQSTDLITAYAQSSMSEAGGCKFFLLATEAGDIFKLDLSDDMPRLKITYFDTIQAVRSIAVLPSGHLFASAESGDHTIYQFTGMAETESVVSTSADDFAMTYAPREQLANLHKLHYSSSIAPINDMLAADLGSEGSNQIYLLCGSRKTSSLRVLRHGLAVKEAAEA
jgi:splicing factor 3B subunit 3